MYLSSFLKILLGMIFLFPSWSFIQRKLKGEFNFAYRKTSILPKNDPFNIFYFGFILGFIIIIIGIKELLQ